MCPKSMQYLEQEALSGHRSYMTNINLYGFIKNLGTQSTTVDFVTELYTNMDQQYISIVEFSLDMTID